MKKYVKATVACFLIIGLLNVTTAVFGLIDGNYFTGIGSLCTGVAFLCLSFAYPKSLKNKGDKEE